MTRVIWYLAVLATVAAAVTVAIFVVFHFITPATAQQNESRAPCCFVHPYYPGVCVVEPIEGETCESILEYLNTPGTVGKSYCKSTLLRGGWEKADCPVSEESAN